MSLNIPSPLSARVHRWWVAFLLHWHEWVIGGSLVLVAVGVALVASVWYGRSFGTAVVEVEHAAYESDGADGEASLPDDVELTGLTLEHQPRKRSRDFKRWTRFKIADEYEFAGRLVVGLKDSKYYVIRIQPKGVQIPTAEQLEEIAETLRSSEHHSTYVYFFLPGMDTRKSPWATVFQQLPKPIQVSFDKTNVPLMYRRYEAQILGGK